MFSFFIPNFFHLSRLKVTFKLPQNYQFLSDLDVLYPRFLEFFSKFLNKLFLTLSNFSLSVYKIHENFQKFNFFQKRTVFFLKGKQTNYYYFLKLQHLSFHMHCYSSKNIKNLLKQLKLNFNLEIAFFAKMLLFSLFLLLFR